MKDTRTDFCKVGYGPYLLRNLRSHKQTVCGVFLRTIDEIASAAVMSSAAIAESARLGPHSGYRRK